MHSTNNERKSVIAERFIRTFKKNYKCITSVSKNLYIDKLDNKVNKYNNTCHSTIKKKTADPKSNAYIDSSKEINDKNLWYWWYFSDICDTVRIYKVYTPNWSEEAFVIKKVKNVVPWTFVINDLNGKEIVGTFYKN